MKLPPELKYTDSHEWVRWETDGSATIGITDFAQESLGDLVFVELPQVGQSVKAGEPCAVVESVKAASDVYAPIDGEVLAVNQDVAEKPESINADAFSAWLFRLRPLDSGAKTRLIDAAQYASNVAQQK
ncbi:MAG TPA: glycine cleavage system protein GcvH [Burkholderiaceae bacterium]|jgi:glycine cleavage system H protein|nr:glycine cleavage system protein GcvH [Burkholderiaceae bacterium]